MDGKVNYYLDIQNENVTIFKIQKKNELSIEKVINFEIEDLEKNLNLIKKSLTLHKIQSVSVILNKSDAISRFITLPASSEEEVKQMIQFEIIKYLPYDYENYYHYYQIFDISNIGAKILFFAIEKELIDLYIKTADKLKLRIEEISLDSLILANYFKENFLIDEDEELFYLLICPLKNSIHIISYFQKSIVNMQIIDIDYNKIKKDAIYRMKVISQIKINFEQLKRELKIHSKKVKIIIPNFLNDLQLTLSIPVEKETITLPFFQNDSEELPLKYFYHFSTNAKSWDLNLLPDEYKSKLYQKVKQQKYIMLTISILIFIFSIYFFFFNIYTSKKKALNKYRDILVKYGTIATDLNKKQKRVAALKKYLRSEPDILKILDKIASIPLISSKNRKVSLVQFVYIKDKNIKISGHAKDIPAFLDFKKKLKELKIFKKVEQKPLSYKNLNGKKIITFEFVCKF